MLKSIACYITSSTSWYYSYILFDIIISLPSKSHILMHILYRLCISSINQTKKFNNSRLKARARATTGGPGKYRDRRKQILVVSASWRWPTEPDQFYHNHNDWSNTTPASRLVYISFFLIFLVCFCPVTFLIWMTFVCSVGVLIDSWWFALLITNTPC